jgi:pimeloyl-ACP methyl ester carboxylesterase
MRRRVAGLIAGLLSLAGLAAPAHAVAAPDRPWRCDAPGGVGQRTIVLLVHGFNSSPATWNDTSKKYLASNPATCITTFDYSTVSTSWITDLDSGQASIAHDLATTIVSLAEQSKNGGGSGKIIVVAHSMGGLATRCATDPACSGGVQGVAEHIRAMITFGTPTQGSFLRADGRSYLANLIGPLLSASCYAGVLKPPVLDGLCNQVRALGTSKAAKAFTPGSAQLTSIKVDTPFPIMALAGSVKLDTSFFGHAVTTVADAGDLVVDQASALAAHKTIQGVGGTQVIDCGHVDLTGLGGGIVTAALYQATFTKVTCQHISETNDPQFLALALHQITTMITEQGASPCTAAAITRDLAGHPRVHVDLCRGDWAVAEVCGGECVDSGKIVHRVAGRWRVVGYVLQDCQEELLSQGVPQKVAVQFGYRICGAPPASSLLPCTADKLAEGIFTDAHIVYDVSRKACEGGVAVAFATENSGASVSDPDFGYFAFTAGTEGWVSHGRVRTPTSAPNFNEGLTKPLSAAQLAIGWRLQQSIR